ncbi:Protein of unknown function [Ligilactobacillus sp. WC1T17]|uniref:DUF2974 domain-containing protein n=1 Tax=Ligilactobacillus ruminis TaxID=1623 RepID=A0ABY1AEP8_9LACO|nr:Protein of unknown function [Ligilactobacillus ruminis]
MGTIFDYVLTNQKTFAEEALTALDSLILAQAAYFDYSQAKAINCFKDLSDAKMITKMTSHILGGEDNQRLLQLLCQSRRFQNITWQNFQRKLDPAEEMQFGAVTFKLTPDTYYIAYRGTNATVTGWKESLSLSYKRVIPSQKAALHYFKHIVANNSGHYYLGGHSKGGNLAIYSALAAPVSFQSLLIRCDNFDGPGFLSLSKQQRQSAKYLQKIIHKYIPEDSLFGTMLDSSDDYVVVKSSSLGPLQHNMFTWQINDGYFVTANSPTPFAKINRQAIQRWVDETTPEEKAFFLNTLYQLAEGSDSPYLRDLFSQKGIKSLVMGLLQSKKSSRDIWLKLTLELIRNYREAIDRQIRELN